MWLPILWCVVIVAALILFYRQKYSIFKQRGLKHKTPLPILGNLATVTLCMEHFSEYLLRTYKSFPEERFIGHFEFTNPVVFVRDLELIKQITIKDFDYFLDHRTVVDDKVDPFWGRGLFSLKGHEWKDMRSTLSPAFTSSKIRHMVPFMTEVGEVMVQSIKKKIKETGSTSIVLDTRDLTTRYSNDVIASCAFGLKVDSESDPDNSFYTVALEASTFRLKQFIIFFAYNSFPKLMSFFKVSVFNKMSKNFFKTLVTKTMREREEKNIIRPDMIHLLMEAKKGKLTHDDKIKDSAVGFATVEESDIGKQKIMTEWSDDDLTAQALIFVIGGLETVSSAMTFALHELAINSQVQERLFQEIKEYNAKNNGKLDFDTLQKMEYMDMVVSEVLRLWSPAFMLDRLCTKDYNLGKPNKDAKEDYIIRKGEGLIIPVWAFHRNPEFFPNPDKFDPERFSDENKSKITSFAYMPFGVGPRNCIGSRFALCELKAVIFEVLLHIEVSPSKQTTIPIEISRSSLNPRIKNGHFLQFKVRS